MYGVTSTKYLHVQQILRWYCSMTFNSSMHVLWMEWKTWKAEEKKTQNISQNKLGSLGCLISPHKWIKPSLIHYGDISCLWFTTQPDLNLNWVFLLL